MEQKFSFDNCAGGGGDPEFKITRRWYGLADGSTFASLRGYERFDDPCYEITIGMDGDLSASSIHHDNEFDSVSIAVRDRCDNGRMRLALALEWLASEIRKRERPFKEVEAKMRRYIEPEESGYIIPYKKVD